MSNGGNTMTDYRLATALAKAQGAMSNVLKDSKNPHFKSTFASLAAVRDVVIPALAAEGVAVVQMPGNDAEGRVTIRTVLLAGSEQLDCGTVATTALVRGGNEAQAVGSALTYLRRYALAAIAGVAQEDDDGNASGPRNGDRRPTPAPQPHPALAMARAKIKSTFGADVGVAGSEARREAEEFARDTCDRSLGEALADVDCCQTILAALASR